MKKNRKKIFIVLALLFFIGIGVFVYNFFQQKKEKENEINGEEIVIHETMNEGWYFLLYAEDKNGKEYDLIINIFRNTLFHFWLIAKDEDKIVYVKKDFLADNFDKLCSEEFCLSGLNARDHSSFSLQADYSDLNFDFGFYSINGGFDFIEKKEGLEINAKFWPQLNFNGDIMVEGKRLRLNGKAVLGQQWGDWMMGRDFDEWVFANAVFETEEYYFFQVKKEGETVLKQSRVWSDEGEKIIKEFNILEEDYIDENGKFPRVWKFASEFEGNNIQLEALIDFDEQFMAPNFFEASGIITSLSEDGNEIGRFHVEKITN